jgi:GntR family transcriptional regulator, rspAB operon transcriptional repressor
MQGSKPSASSSTDRNRLTAEAYAALKAAILSGELQPRDRLYETALARRFKMSRTPVREALQRLVTEGLAESGPDGLAVATLSVEDIRSLEEANRALQCLAAQLAAAKGSESDLATLEEAIVRMEACLRTRDMEGWTGADQEIHRRIFQMCGNRWVWNLLLQMESLVARIRHIALKRPGRLEESTAEHRAVVDAIKSRDPDAARRAMQIHLEKTERNLITILEQFVVPIRGERF